MKTYNGLKEQPYHKDLLNKWIDNLKKSVNSDEGHLADKAIAICKYAKLIGSKGNELFEIFKNQ